MKKTRQILATSLCVLSIAAGMPPAGAAAKAKAAAERSDYHEVALLDAARRGNVASVKRLLDEGVNPNAAVPGDGTALIRAARHGHDELVRYLVGRGANIDLAVPGDGNPLIAAASAGRLSTVRLLLDLGAKVGSSIHTDENALIRASWAGHEEIVRLLISRGADANAQVGPRTALNMARTAGHQNIEGMLRRAGATR